MQRRSFGLLVSALLCGAGQALAGAYDDFFLAIRTDDADAIGRLLQRGFDPNTLSEKLVHPLTLAIQEDAARCVVVLMQAPRINLNHLSTAGESALMMASLRGRPVWVEQLIARGAQVNQTGWTALHYAATSGHAGIIRILIDAHAYIDAESPNGTSPLMMAAQYGTPQAVKLLLEQGADPTLKNQLGLAAVDFARNGGRADSVALIERALNQWGRK
jgi:uncharacterized protein